jgi:hypothetical protein
LLLLKVETARIDFIGGILAAVEVTRTLVHPSDEGRFYDFGFWFFKILLKALVNSTSCLVHCIRHPLHEQ